MKTLGTSGLEHKERLFVWNIITEGEWLTASTRLPALPWVSEVASWLSSDGTVSDTGRDAL